MNQYFLAPMAIGLDLVKNSCQLAYVITECKAVVGKYRHWDLNHNNNMNGPTDERHIHNDF